MPDLPKLLLIADGFCDRAVADRILELVASGLIPWIQLRDHDVESDVFEKAADALVGLIRRTCPETRISLNGHPELARKLDVGVHVGFRGPSPAEVRSIVTSAQAVGYSAHSNSDLSTATAATAATAATVDYYTVSPIYAPISKPHIQAAGLGLLTEFAAACPKPVFALGGITPDRIDECLRAGAYGVAVVGGILLSSTPGLSAEKYVEAICSMQ